MKRTAIISVLVGAVGLVVAPSVGAHNMDLNTANSVSLDHAAKDCAADPSCIAYGAFPCRKVTRHYAICTEHKIDGPVGNQAAQLDCHRDLGLKLRRRSFRITVFPIGGAGFHCSANTEHPGQ